MTTWGVGDYPAMAAALVEASRVTIQGAGELAGARVLDVATGTGNFALLAAEAGAQVIGVDFEPALLAIARARAARAGLAASFVLADASATTVPTGWSDVVASVFGVMYAVDHGAAARELARCVRFGGCVLLASWVPGSLMSAIGAAVAPFLPHLSGPPPSRWGDAAELAALLAPVRLEVESTDRRTIEFSFRDPGAATEFFVRTAGHLVAARAALEVEGRWDEATAAMAATLESRGAERDGAFTVEGEYLVARALRR